MATKAPYKCSVRILYRNWKGDVAVRRIMPIEIWFGSTEWHKQDQWLLAATDLDKNERRDFALQDIVEWLGTAL